MPKAPKKLTKKQLEELERKQKEEEELKRQEEIKRKKEEEARKKREEEERRAEEERKRLAKEELERIAKEEQALTDWKETHERRLSSAYERIIKEEDWNKYSNCEDGYINVSDEKAMNGFIFEFKEKCDTNFISNFKLIEKKPEDEFQVFDYSQLHYHNLERLLLQGRAILERNLMGYSFKYLNTIKSLEMMKIEAFTRYFIENFEMLKDERKKELKEGTGNAEEGKDEVPDTFWEFSNKNGMIRLGFWANNFVTANFRKAKTQFKNIPIHTDQFHQTFIVKNSIIRFFWCGYDIREHIFAHQLEIESAYTPYMSIGGTFYLEELKYPAKKIDKYTWQIRDMIGDLYKAGDGKKDGQFTKDVKTRYKIILPKHIFLKDLIAMKPERQQGIEEKKEEEKGETNERYITVGLYERETGKWRLEPITDVEFKKADEEGNEPEKGKPSNQNSNIQFYVNSLGIFGVLIERKINFPYKNWMLRCIKNEKGNLVAILDLTTPRTSFIFELGLTDELPADSEMSKRVYPTHAYMKLIDNKEKVFEHIAGKLLTFDQMILALKECGILIAPWKEDIESIGYREKNADTTQRAVDDIVMACRYYSIRSHEYNKLIEPDLIAVKAKPNPEFDKYFYDDEEKDWIDFCWYPNKASIGKFGFDKDNKIVFNKTIETTRPKLHLIIKDTQPEDVYYQIVEDDFSSAFLVNIRNVVRVLNLVNIP